MELETGEIKTIELIREALFQSSKNKKFIEARKILTRGQIDSFNIPILYVELETGQNGTLTSYPGNGDGQTWLGADGATITFKNGILKASRGMGDDMMGGSFPAPIWLDKRQFAQYKKELSYLNGNNQIDINSFNCKIKKMESNKSIEIWDILFFTDVYEEVCASDEIATKNLFYIDRQGIVRKSLQYHSETLGYVMTQRLDR